VAYATNGVATSYGDTIAFTTPVAPPFVCGTSTVTYDSHDYTTVQIGGQCWFAENLRNDNYNNGTLIPGSLDNSTWTTTNSGAQAVYGQGGANEASNLATYGRLYNWYAVNTGLLCPTGWHVPTDSEWTTLETGLGGSATAGDAMKAATPSWDGTNSTGFSALPGGYRYDFDGSFQDRGTGVYWWSSSPTYTDGWYRGLGTGSASVVRNSFGMRGGFAVRCVQD
jgi:uncharacterized protein (TIGR02145 family)